MSTLWLIFLCALAGGIVPILRLFRVAPRLGAVLLGLAIATVAAAHALNVKQTERLARQNAKAATTPLGNRGEGYVRSESCASCHPREHETWRHSFHRTMTQIASDETILGKFDGIELEWASSKYKFDRDAEGPFIEMDDPQWRPPRGTVESILTMAPRIKARPNLLTGAHHMQVCWVPTGASKMQVLVPFAWMNADQRWVPFDQTFLRDPALPHLTQTWNKNCMNCHTTGPRPLLEPKKGEAWSTVGELGIACEACHGDGAAHVAYQQNPARRYASRIAATNSIAASARLANPAKLNHVQSSAVCGQCHAIKWYRSREKLNREGLRFNPAVDRAAFGDPILPNDRQGEEWPQYLKYEPNFLRDRFWSDGMVRVSGREYNGLLDSPCYKKGELACISCHSMHDSKPDDQLRAKMETNDACLQCHPKLGENIEKHTHHAAKSTGSLCYNCHMPYTTYGLLKSIRSHQITSPNIKVAHDTGRPDACTGCHLDKSSGWAAENLTKWYGQKMPSLPADERDLPASARLALKGDAGQRALMAEALGWNEAQKIAGADWLAPYLGQLMDDPYPAVRYIAHRSLRTLRAFKDFPFDFTVPPANREPVAPKISAGAPTKIGAEKYTQLLKERDHTSMDLQE